MLNDQIKLSRITARSERAKYVRDMVLEIISNPIVELVGGYALVELFQNVSIQKDRQLIGPVAAASLYTAISGSVWAQQLTKSLPYLAKSPEGMAKLAPLLSI